MYKNALSQSNCKVCKSAICPERIDETAWFFAYSYELMKTKIWLKNCWMGIVKNGCSHRSKPKIIKVFWWFQGDRSSLTHDHFEGLAVKN